MGGPAAAPPVSPRGGTPRMGGAPEGRGDPFLNHHESNH
jgi:hypothetical protein